jgi:hypothetical protein
VQNELLCSLIRSFGAFVSYACMYVCMFRMHACMYVCFVCMHVCMYVSYACMYVCMFRMHARMYGNNRTCNMPEWLNPFLDTIFGTVIAANCSQAIFLGLSLQNSRETQIHAMACFLLSITYYNNFFTKAEQQTSSRSLKRW